MRSPKKDNIIILLIFLIISLIWVTAASVRDVEDLNSDQQYVLTHAVKHLKPDLYQKDLLYQHDVADSYIPLYLNYLGFAYKTTGNLNAGYKFFVFPLNFIYLIGAYLLFKEIINKKWLPVILAVVSSMPLSVPIAGEYFGIGPIQMITARTVFTAFFPFVALMFYKWIDMPPRLFIVFFIIGLLSNIHPPSGLFLTEIFILVLLFYKPFNLKNIAYVCGYGVVMLAGAIYFVIAQLKTADIVNVPQGSLNEIFKTGISYLFYPFHTLTFIPQQMLHIITAVLIISPLIFIVLFRLKRENKLTVKLFIALNIVMLLYILASEIKNYLVLITILIIFSESFIWDRKTRLWTYFGIAAFMVGIGGVLAGQYIFSALNLSSLFGNQIRATRFLGFYVYLLFALVLRGVDIKALKPYKKAVLTLLVVLVVFSSLRHTYRTYIRYKPSVNTEMAQMAKWANENTAKDTVFMTDSLTFRLVSERAVFVCKKDGPAFYYSYPHLAEEWVKRLGEISTAKKSSQDLVTLAKRYDIHYVILSDKGMLNDYDVLYKTEHLALVNIDSKL